MDFQMEIGASLKSCTALSTSEYNQTRTRVFSQLPVDIQYQIWDVAIRDSENLVRVLPIASDNGHKRTMATCSEYALSVIVGPKIDPSFRQPLLHVNRYTRNKMLAIYVPWPCATAVETSAGVVYRKDGRQVFVKPKTDVFLIPKRPTWQYYFSTAIWVDRRDPRPSPESPEFQLIRSRFLAIVQSVRYIAMDIITWNSLGGSSWREIYPELIEITVTSCTDYKTGIEAGPLDQFEGVWEQFDDQNSETWSHKRSVRWNAQFMGTGNYTGSGRAGSLGPLRLRVPGSGKTYCHLRADMPEETPCEGMLQRHTSEGDAAWRAMNKEQKRAYSALITKWTVMNEKQYWVAD